MIHYLWLRVRCLFGLHTRYSTWCIDCGRRSWVCIACHQAELDE